MNLRMPQAASYRAIVSDDVSARGTLERLVTGHKTRAVFDRYHIVSPADLQDVARRLTQLDGPGRPGTFPGTDQRIGLRRPGSN